MLKAVSFSSCFCQIFTGLLLSVFLASIPAQGAQSDPAAQIVKIGDAIDAADVQAFQNLVDLDALLPAAFNTFLAETKKEKNSSRISPVLALVLAQLSGDGQSAAGLRKLILAETRSFVLNGVQSGAFAGRQPDLAQASGVLAPLFANASMGRKEITFVGTPEKEDGDWLVPFTVRDHDNEQDYSILGRLSETGTGLKLTGVDNLPELVQQIIDESIEAGNQ